eukprot:CAMPEP_0181110530 /NCGR_PEP_ID=MMETSP1071-20121207/18767_1 /TAXON_ID=35127 /ORGANISM="Thalassiosira sp., Strain NH16" /LENGTH=40 /DNA_ID= /DNA_START= /DNA_END= /DNA_ORIENTATION=
MAAETFSHHHAANDPKIEIVEILESKDSTIHFNDSIVILS